MEKEKRRRKYWTLRKLHIIMIKEDVLTIDREPLITLTRPRNGAKCSSDRTLPVI